MMNIDDVRSTIRILSDECSDVTKPLCMQLGILESSMNEIFFMGSTLLFDYLLSHENMVVRNDDVISANSLLMIRCRYAINRFMIYLNAFQKLDSYHHDLPRSVKLEILDSTNRIQIIIDNVTLIGFAASQVMESRNGDKS